MQLWFVLFVPSFLLAACHGGTAPPLVEAPEPEDIERPVPAPAVTADIALRLHHYADLRRESFMPDRVVDAEGFFGWVDHRGHALVRLDEEGMIFPDERLWKGPGELDFTRRLYGTFPDDLYMTTYRDTGGPMEGQIWRWGGTGWEPQIPAEEAFKSLVLGMGPWKGQGLVSVHFFHNGFDAPSPELGFTSHEHSVDDLPTPNLHLDAEVLNDVGWLDVVVATGDFDIFRFVPGLPVTTARWDGAKLGPWQPVTANSGDIFEPWFPLARSRGSGSERYVLLKSDPPVVLRREALGWRPMPLPPSAGVVYDIAFEEGGTLWLASAGGLFQHRDARWHTVSLKVTDDPEPDAAVGHVLRYEGALWVAKGTQLWSTRPPPNGEVQSIPNYEATTQQELPTRSLAWPKVATDRCERVYILLDTVAREAPRRDLPALRAALRDLKGVRIVRSRAGEQDRIGVECPGLEVARRAQRALADLRSLPHPEPLCHLPSTVAELPTNGLAWKDATPRSFPAPAEP